MKMNQTDFKSRLKEKTEHVNAVLAKYMPEADGAQRAVIDAMSYSVTAGGKRVRPMLMEECALLFGGSEDIEPFMSAIEMIHTYSLVHDDLPAMDNDKYRRGKKTTWYVFGEDLGVLCGDALLNYAFETMAEAALRSKTPGRCLEALSVIAKKAGIYGMIGGQTIDVESSGENPDARTVMLIHSLKTAALIEASMKAGAILAGADSDAADLIEDAAGKIGLAFQIQDDILDVTGSEDVLGKPVLSDEKNLKTTYVTINGIEESRKRVASLSREAEEQIRQIGENDFLIELIEHLIYREK